MALRLPRGPRSPWTDVALAIAALLSVLSVALASRTSPNECRASFANPDRICFANGLAIDTHAQAALAHHAKLRARQSSSPGPHVPDRGRQRGQFQHNMYDQPRVYLVHVGGALSAQARAAIESHAGVVLGGYIPHHSYFVTATPSQAERLRSAPGVQWIDAHRSEHKISHTVSSFAAHTNELVATVRTEGDINEYAAILEKALREEFSGSAISVRPSREAVRVKCGNADSSRVAERLAHEPLVSWVEGVSPSAIRNRHAATLLTSGLGDGLPSNNPLWARGIHGENQIVAVADDALDFDHCSFLESGSDTASSFVAAFADPTRKDTNDVIPPANRKKLLRYWISPADGAVINETHTNSEHGTHVAGTVLGKVPTDWVNATEAAEMSKYNGLAYEAKLVFQHLGGTTGKLFTPANLFDLFQPAYDFGARIHTNSWGCSNPAGGQNTDCNTYSTQTRDVDAFTFQNQDFLVLVAGGNDGEGGSSNGTIGDPATCKNCISVGASHNSVDAWKTLGKFDKDYYGFCVALNLPYYRGPSYAVL
eukprot:tig00020564_g11447.t1